MGQYYRFVNTTLKQFFSGHALPASIKLEGVLGLPLSGMLAWTLLPPGEIPRYQHRGAWAGHNVRIAGDEGAHEDLYELAAESFTDISVELFTEWVNEDFDRCFKYWSDGVVDDDGKLVPDSLREAAAARNQSRDFPTDRWLHRFGPGG